MAEAVCTLKFEGHTCTIVPVSEVGARMESYSKRLDLKLVYDSSTLRRTCIFAWYGC